MTPRWSGPDAEEVPVDPRADTLDALQRLLEPLALDVPLLLHPAPTDPERGTLDALPEPLRARLARMAGAAATLLDDSRKVLAVRETLPPAQPMAPAAWAAMMTQLAAEAPEQPVDPWAALGGADLEVDRG